jgi:hypothetical protein
MVSVFTCVALAAGQFACTTPGGVRRSGGGDETVSSAAQVAVLKNIVVGDRLAAQGEWEKVEVLREGRSLRTRVPMELLSGDEVLTAQDALAVVRFPGGAEVFLQPGSRVRVGSLFQSVGELFVKVEGYFRVKTRYVSASSEGTRYFVMVSRDDKAAVAVLEGRVELTSEFFPVRYLTAGQRATVTAGRPLAVSNLSSRELAELNRWVGQIEQLTAGEPGATSGGVPKWVLPAVIGATVAIIGGILLREHRKDRPRRTPREEPPSTPETPSTDQGSSTQSDTSTAPSTGDGTTQETFPLLRIPGVIMQPQPQIE